MKNNVSPGIVETVIEGGLIEKNKYGVHLADADPGHSVVIKGTAVIDGNNIADSEGIKVDGPGSTVTMSGGTIKNNKNGIHLLGNQTTMTNILTMTGGTIIAGTNNPNAGVEVDGNNTTVTMSGGSVENYPYGVDLNGGATESFTLSNGEINNCYTGVFTTNGNKTVEIAGGTIQSTGGNVGTGAGIQMIGNDNTFTMSGGTITGLSDGFKGDSYSETGCNFSMSGGQITGCTYAGVLQYSFNMVLSGTADISNQAEKIGTPGYIAPDIVAGASSVLFSHSNPTKAGYTFHILEIPQGQPSATYAARPIGQNSGTDVTNDYYEPTNVPTRSAAGQTGNFLYIWWEPPYVAPPSYSDPVTPSPSPILPGGGGWDSLSTVLETIPDGGSLEINMNGTTIVPGKAINTLQGKDVNVVLDMGNGIKWTINGKNITNLIGDVNMGVSIGTSLLPIDVINNLTKERYSIQIKLAHNGPFGFSATLTIPMRIQDAGLFANLFRYVKNKSVKASLAAAGVTADSTETGTMVFMSAGKIVADGSVDLEFDGAPDVEKGSAETAYAIVVDDHSLDPTVKPNPETLTLKATSKKGKVSLSWNKLAGAKKYRIYQKIGKTYKKLAEQKKNILTVKKAYTKVKLKKKAKTTLKQKKLIVGKKYTFVVKAFVNDKWTKITKTSTKIVKVKK